MRRSFIDRLISLDLQKLSKEEIKAPTPNLSIIGNYSNRDFTCCSITIISISNKMMGMNHLANIQGENDAL